MATWVLLRGLVRESRHWEQFPDQLRAQFPSDAVIPVDLPGNGALNHLRSPTRIEGFVAELRAQLSARGLQPPFRVVALSLGAMTAISWMSDYPGEVECSVLMNTSVARFNPFYQRLRPENYAAIAKGLFSTDRLKRERIILDITANTLSDTEKHALARRWAGYASDAGVSRVNALRQLWAAARFRAPGSLPASASVLVLNGAGDRLVNPVCSRDLAAAWNLPLKVEANAGHDLTLDAGGWVVNQISDWLTP